MNIVELNDLIRKISLACPLVNSYYNMSPYECWNTKEVRYGSVAMDVTNVSTNTAISTYQCLFYYGDRLTESRTNKNSVRADAISVLDSIISKLYEQDGVSITFSNNYTLFEQKFEDELAGAYVTVDIQVMGDGMCGFDVEIGSDFEVTQLHETIKDNGIYEWRNSGVYYDQVVIDVDVPLQNPTFADIGYEQGTLIDLGNPSTLNEDLKFSKQLYDEWNPENTTAYQLYAAKRTLRYVPNIDISNVTNAGFLCAFCDSLLTVPKLNTSKVTNMENLFYRCLELKQIPQIDTSRATNVSGMFFECISLKYVPLLDFSNVTTIPSTLTFQKCFDLENLGGFRGVKVDLNLGWSTKLTHDSLMNIINNLYDLTSNGLGGKTLVLGSTNLFKLTADEIAIATNKGWIVS